MDSVSIVYYDNNVDQLVIMESDIITMVQFVIAIGSTKTLAYVGTLEDYKTRDYL